MYTAGTWSHTNRVHFLTLAVMNHLFHIHNTPDQLILIGICLCASPQVAGSVWYLLAVQRVESCIYLQCKDMNDCRDVYMGCPSPISYGYQPTSQDPSRLAWAQDPTFDSQCLKGGAHSVAGNFSFGIYALAVPIVRDVHTPVNRIVLPLFWGIMTMRYASIL
jgi:hypothetical protein